VSSLVYYLYGIGWSEELAPILSDPGRLADLPPDLMLISAQDLSGVVKPVPEKDFGEDALVERVRDVDWLTVQATRHNAILSLITREATVIPLKFGLVFHNEENVRIRLETDYDRCVRQLRMLCNRQEWGVKVYADLERIKSVVLAQDTVTPVGSSPGRAYIMQRRAQLSVSEKARDLARNHARQVLESLERVTVRWRTNQVLSREATGRTDDMMLNAVFLVEAGTQESFCDLVRQLDGAIKGIALELSGPWPPYNFTADSE